VISQRQLRYFTLYTVLFCGTPLVVMMEGCVSIKPIDPAQYTVSTGHYLEVSDDRPGEPEGYGHSFDEATYNVAVEERKHKLNRERWFAFGCDVVTTVICVATGRGAELGGNVLIAPKIVGGYYAQKKINRWDDEGNHTPYKIVSAAHLGACALNVLTCKLY